MTLGRPAMPASVCGLPCRCNIAHRPLANLPFVPGALRRYVIGMVLRRGGARTGRWGRPRAMWGTVLLLFGLTALDPAVAQQPERGADVYGEQNDEGGYDFYADNTHFIPMWINVSFEELINLEPTVDLPYQRAVQPGAERTYLFSLEPVSDRGRRGYSLVFRSAEGDPSTAEPDGYRYLLPFEHGTKHRITQGYHGDFSHFGENEYAVDFDMDTGTPVYSARGGIVVRVKEDSNVGGPNMSYSRYGNVIMIAHDDGTFGNYVHLRHRGSEVEMGERVEAGQLIGYSGATGVASGPHLHFDVRLPRETGKMESIPFHFRGPDGEALDPQEGNVYYAVHPGGPAFEMVFGEDLTNRDFADHREQIPVTNNIEFRTEEYDLTYAVFVGNGFPEDIEATIDFRLSGMTADADLPMDIRIPARTEVFVTLLRANPEANRWQYAPSVRYRRVR